jgi:hypothetical protein
MSLNTIDRALITRHISLLNQKLKRLEGLLSGQALTTVRFANAAITNAKIASLIADKILTGNLIVGIGIGESENGYILLDGENNREVMSDGTDIRLLIGNRGDGTFTIRISLPGIDVFDSDDPRDFSLFADDDNVLIKEASRGVLPSGGTVDHDLGYFPHYYAYAQTTGGRMQIANSYDPNAATRSYTSKTQLTISGAAEFAGNARYFIFYDEVPE